MTRSHAKSSTVGRVLAVVIAGLSLYFLLPALVHVFSVWPKLFTLDPWWLLVALMCEVLSFICSIALLRLILRTRSWFAVVTASLAGNAVTNTLPGGDAVGASVQYRMLKSSGIDSVQAASGLAVSSVINVAALFALPIFALPVIVGGEAISPGLLHAGILGVIGFLMIVAAGTLVVTTDKPVRTLGNVLQWAVNKLPRKIVATANGREAKERAESLSQRLLDQRDKIRADLGKNWRRGLLLVAGRIGFDYACLLAVLSATGAKPNPSLILLAYAGTTVLALLPLTPGGLGIVEASLSGLLVLAHVPSANAVVATLGYRVASYWLPTVAGAASYALYRRRYGPLDDADSAKQATPDVASPN